MSNAMKSSKFKPATGGLPSFSTAGFRKPRPSGSSETIDISNDSGSSPSLKRTSSDSSDPQPPTKRRKSDKENHFDLQPASSIVKGKARALDEHPPSPPIPTEFADLQSKSAVQLQEMLLANHEYNRHNMELIYNYHSHRHGELTSEDSKADFFTLESIKSLLDSRISAIKKALQRREQVRTRSPSPRRPALSISTRSPSPRRPAPSISTSISRSTVSRQDTISVTSGAMPLLASTSANTTRIERQPTLPSNTIDIDDEDELWADVNEVTMEDLRDSDIARQESVTSPYTKEIMQNLQVFGIPKFRTNQSEAIHATMAGRDVFVLMPTGGGKSLCYQLPAICRGGKTKGVTVVISPLLSLMSDQVQGLRDKGISAESLTSDTSEDDVKAIRARFYSNTKPSLLYVAPERLQISSSLQNMLGNLHRQKELARFVIDEAHCISTWGQDFREAYQDLHKLREQYPDVPIMALTATADHRTRDDILARLNLKDPVVFTQSFDRPNLFYRIVPKATIEELIKYIKESHPGQSGIIYRRSRDGCEKLAQQLRNKGLKAKHFHAGLDKTEKDATQNEWKRNPGHIIVATIAFGMGIDKADVRFVIHYDLPKSMDGYYQETGRAGRDQLPAECILHYCYRDVQPFRTMIRNNKDKMATRESIARQEEALNVVVRYCQNNTICRRTQILQHFGEQFDETECKGRCNNCAEKGTRVHQDITDDARTVLSLVQTLELGKENVTLDHCRHIFKGSNLAAIREKQHDKLSAFGAGRGIANDLLDLIFYTCLSLEALEEKSVLTNNKWHHNYLRLGRKANEYLDGRKEIKVDYKPSTPKSTAGGKAKAPRRARNPAPANQQPERLQPLYADDDEIEWSPKKKSAVAEVVEVISDAEDEKPTGPPRAANEGTLHNRLVAHRQSLLAQNPSLSPGEILEDDALCRISATAPQDFISFKKVLQDIFEDFGADASEAKEEAEARFKKFGHGFLQLCQGRSGDASLRDKYAFKPESASTPNVRKFKFKPAPGS